MASCVCVVSLISSASCTASLSPAWPAAEPETFNLTLDKIARAPSRFPFSAASWASARPSAAFSRFLCLSTSIFTLTSHANKKLGLRISADSISTLSFEPTSLYEHVTSKSGVLRRRPSFSFSEHTGTEMSMRKSFSSSA
ncbi:two component transcriptional regulator [Striga asiatica]|uniref:Two component transcriptional regulator n=1 Tax=Striga asiatica TaxID=4170 RepID=A0A5A7P8G5_STRAF|nr:two component transcriptional regulator [Striga asiatica]